MEVVYDSKRISFEDLIRKADRKGCGRKVYCRTDGQFETAKKIMGDRAVRTDKTVRPDKRPKYYLSGTFWRYVPMTELQAMRVNSALAARKDPGKFLSPRQARLFEVVRKNRSAGWENRIGERDLIKAWKETWAVVDSLRED